MGQWSTSAASAPSNTHRHTRRTEGHFTIFAGVSPQSGRGLVHLLTIHAKHAACAWSHKSSHVQVSQKKNSPRWSSRRQPEVTQVISALFNMSRECGAAGKTTDPQAACRSRTSPLSVCGVREREREKRACLSQEIPLQAFLHSVKHTQALSQTQHSPQTQ